MDAAVKHRGTQFYLFLLFLQTGGIADMRMEYSHSCLRVRASNSGTFFHRRPLCYESLAMGVSWMCSTSTALRYSV